MYRFICAFLAFLFTPLCLASVNADPPLIVYIRDSFYEKWHELLEKDFPSPVRFIRLPSSALMARLRMEGNATKADIVLGIDSCYMAELKEMNCVSPSHVDRSLYSLPVPWDQDFVPFCYGYIGLLYHEKDLKHPPQHWEDVAALPPKSTVMPNPLTSTVGMVFLDVLTKKSLPVSIAAFQEKLRATPKGLSESFGLFATGKASLTLAYTTSAAHRQEQYHNKDIKPLVFRKHPFLAYVAFATHKGGLRPQTRLFLEMLISDSVQKQMYERDHLYPVTKDARTKAGLDQGEPLPLLPLSNFTAADQKSLARTWRLLTAR